MLEYQPYFYIIQNKLSGRYYAGSKYSEKGTDPSYFMTEEGYQTSSNIIKALIELNGLDSFVIRKLKLFESASEALDYETRFLQKVNARSNPNFYNGHNNDGYYDREKAKLFMIELYGVDNYAKTEEFKNKIKEISLEKYGVEHHLMSDEIIDKRTKSNLKKYGYENVSSLSETKVKVKKTKLEKYGIENFVNPERAKETCIERYGVDHHSKTEERKISQIQNQQKKNDREIVTQLKTLIEEAKQLDIDYGALGLKRFWWQKKIEDLLEIQTNLIGKIQAKLDNGYVKKTKKQKMKELNEYLFNREIVKQIKQLSSSKGIKLGPAWWRQSDEALSKLLEELK